MIPQELVKKIRRIQIKTSHKVDDLLAGQYHSAFKGRGIEFEEVRPYQTGDDIRAIDWNVTARSNQPYIKLFREERELTVFLLVDLSASQGLGTHFQTKRDLVTEIGSTLAFSAIRNNDKVGLMLFTDGIEKTIPPRKGSKHVLRCIRELLYCEPMGQGTDLAGALTHLSRTVKRRSIVFVVSDFQDKDYERAMRIARRKHDIIPVVIGDRRELEMPNVGMIELQDSETGQVTQFDTASRRNRELFSQRAKSQIAEQDNLFRRLKIEPIRIMTGEDYVDPIREYFHRRGEKK